MTTFIVIGVMLLGPIIFIITLLSILFYKIVSKVMELIISLISIPIELSKKILYRIGKEKV